jgi:hypothetical protein
MPASLPDSSASCQASPSTPLLPSPYGDPLPGILPTGGISLLAGAPNVGKTSLLAGMLRSFRDGAAIFGRQPNPVSAIGYINADRGWDRGSGVWFERAGYPEITQYSMSDDEGFNPKRLRKKHERTDILAGFIDRLQLPAHALIVVDPLALFLGGNLLNYDDCAVACHEIRRYLQAKSYTMLATAHSAKIKSDKKERYMRLQDQVLGSTAISGFTDTMMYLASPQETGKAWFTFLWHPHALPAETFQLTQGDQGLFEAYSGPTSRTGDVADGTIDRVFALLPEDGRIVDLGEIVDNAQVYPLSKASVKRALESLLDDGRITKPFHGRYARVTVQ